MQNMQGMRERGEGGCCCLVVEFLNCTIGICKICKVGGVPRGLVLIIILS